MSWLITLAAFLGKFLAQLIPAIGNEIRKNNTVEQIGADDEVLADISDDIDSGVDRNGLRMDEAGDKRTP